MRLNVNYFVNLGGEYHLPKVRYNKSNFPKRIKHQYNLPYIYLCVVKLLIFFHIF